MKKLLAFLLTATMILSLAVIGTSAAADKWDGSVAASFESGTGTEADPFVIKTGAQLAYLAASVKAGNTYAGQYFVLASDLDLAKIEWTPIGIYIGKSSDANVAFAGNFDGKGYTVSGIQITDDSNSLYVGLFGLVGTAGYIKNITVADSSISSGTEKSRYAGAVAGKMEAGEVSSLVVKEDVTVASGGSAGGVCGRIVGAKASYLINYATVTTSVVDSSGFGGGIAGTVGGGATLEYAANFGTVSGLGAFHGGIAGITGGDSGLGALKNCVNFADVTYNGEKSWYVGGIAGCFGHTAGHEYNNENCFNLGKVTAGFDGAAVGEIIGEARKGDINMKSLYSVDLENLNAIGKESTAPKTLEDVVNKTADELATLADAIVATVNANIVVPTVEPEVTEPETTEPAPETTEPVTPPTTGDSALIFVVIAVLSIAAVAVVAKKRVNE